MYIKVITREISDIFNIFDTLIIMVALWNMADHYICILWFLLSSAVLFSFLA